ncbi:sororin [Diretmus argenteus]
MAPSANMKRSIVVKKIAPRKTVAPSDEHNKENVQQKKTKISTPVPDRVSSPKQQQAAMLPSPVLASSPALPPQPAADPRDLVWSQKVRRSYSRLSDQSLSSPEADDKLFGFGNLKTPTVCRAGQSRTGLEVSGSLSGFSSFTSLLDAEDCAASFLEPDPNIPGVPLDKQKRRRRRCKVQQLDVVELDALAAKMNAEFEEAEGFDLLVE